jgi:hypothetical protein
MRQEPSMRRPYLDTHEQFGLNNIDDPASSEFLILRMRTSTCSRLRDKLKTFSY